MVATLLIVGLGACNGHTGASNKLSANPQAKQDTQQFQTIVQSCMTKGVILTNSGRTAILNCIAPKGHKQQFENCAQSHIGTDGFVSTTQRQKLMQDLTICLEQNR